ncbi:hypothetical protein SDC9_26910 [bioreactor metagenome]|uniref:Uncharacterized protein n=1 Tax=bioreactor metagenome TaxID=1076179 RepID=A0A644UQG5_9ZZZZ
MRAGRLCLPYASISSASVLKTREQRARDFAVACMPWRAVKTLAAILMPKKGSEAATRLDARGFALEGTQVVQAAAAHAALRDQLNAVDEGRVERENTFHAHAVGNLAHRKGGAGGAALDADNVTLEDLDTFFFAFHNAQVHFHRVAGAKRGKIHALVFQFNFPDDVHRELLANPGGLLRRCKAAPMRSGRRVASVVVA